MVVMEEKGWAKVGQGLTGLVIVGAVATGLYFWGREVYDDAKSAGAEDAESTLTDKLTKEGRLIPEGGCFRYVFNPRGGSEHYQGVAGKCEGLDFAVALKDGKPTSITVEGFDTKLTLNSTAPYVTDVQRQGNNWTPYTPTPSNP